MLEKPVVGNIYRVISNVGIRGEKYHYIDVGELVICIDDDGTEMREYRAIGKEDTQFIHSHDLELVDCRTYTPRSTVYERIIQWADDRNILEGSTRKDQMTKLMEEIGELASGIAKGNELLVKDSIGDALVVLTIIAEQSGTNIAECLNLAWNEIKDRKGKMVDGIFIKEGNQ